jgi:CheY-like chemotaxis protein
LPESKKSILARDANSGLPGFETLMPYRIQEVVLVSSLYDAFILQEDGQLADLLMEGGGELSLRGAPEMVRVPDAAHALERVMNSGRQNELIIITPQMGGIDPVSFAEEVKAHSGSTPVVLLGYDAGATMELLREHGQGPFDEVFLWTGDSRILNSIVTLLEDRANCLHDCEIVGVRAILVVENSLNFLSAYLPLLYTEIMQQSRSVLSEGVNLSHKLLRRRARPKILLARDLQTAYRLYAEHREHLLGVITDVGLPRNRRSEDVHDAAGIEFVQHVRAQDPIMPVLMQSSNAANALHAKELKTSFVRKGSSQLHHEMRRFLLSRFGFGPFRFRKNDGTVENNARSIRELERALRKVSDESLLRHARRNSYSTWLRARTEFQLADQLMLKQVDDFSETADLREYLVDTLYQARKQARMGVIADFNRHTFDDTINFSRIGRGSLGGKARGIAFMNRLLPFYDPENPFDDVEIHVPPAVVLTTEVFDGFLRRNHLYKVALDESTPQVQRFEKFQHGRFSSRLISDLRAMLNTFRDPLAVRSSSLLEDSHHQPFAGIYETVMIPNTGTTDERLASLCRAIKQVFASTFSDRARAYLRATPYHHEEEKMAVVIQPVFGRPHEGGYYPTFAGVARSHNFYPHGKCTPDDGVCTVGLGLGKLVVAGEGGLRFCPQYPQSLPDFSSAEEILENAQRNFYALPMDAKGTVDLAQTQLRRLPIQVADQDGALTPLGSTWSPDDGRITDGVSRGGTRLVTFASVLKHDSFPLAILIRRLLRIGKKAMGCPVEIEFAVDLEVEEGEVRRLALLQIRPMSVSETNIHVDLAEYSPEQVLCASDRAFGNGRIEGIHDIVLIDPADFDRAKSTETTRVLARLNAQFLKSKTPYLLIGPGRWGSQDPWLGIPVDWSDISGARVVVETGFKNFRVKPSEGSHFFHNMTSFRVGYFTLNPQDGEGVLNLEWLRRQNVVESAANGLKHFQLSSPLTVLLDGKEARGAILKPSI